MLDRTVFRPGCVVCGRPLADPAFAMHGGRPANGPAYWSDRGLLCSLACALAHERQRREAGEPMTEPAENPLDRSA